MVIMVNFLIYVTSLKKEQKTKKQEARGATWEDKVGRLSI